MLNCLKQKSYIYGNSPPDWHPQPFMTQSSPTPGNDALSTDGRGTRFILSYVGPEGTFRDRRTRARSCSHKSKIEKTISPSKCVTLSSLYLETTLKLVFRTPVFLVFYGVYFSFYSVQTILQKMMTKEQ